MKRPSLLPLLVLAMILACNLGRSGLESPTVTPGQTINVSEPTGNQSAGPTNTDGADVIYIPPTTFLMGAAAGDSQADADEQPAHQVSLSGFYIYAREVTNRMYLACVRAGACFPIQPLPNGPTSHYNDPTYADYPVVGVDWHMARDYCRWAGGRLPTEAEWELAARGAEGFLYPWGNEPAPSCDRLNMFGCLNPPETRQVGSYPLGASPFGVLDMAGNVWEWVNDWYDANYYAVSSTSNPLGPLAPPDPKRPLKVVRGGSWNSYPQDVRTTARTWANLYLPYDDLGFRCVAQTESWPAELTLPAPGHGLPESSGPSLVGAKVGEDPNLWATLQGVSSTCPDAQGIVHVHILFDVSEDFEEHYRYSGALYHANSADTDPCQYDSDHHLLHCAGPVDLLETRLGGMGDYYYVVQVCLIDKATNQAVACAEVYILQETDCPGENWVTGCDVACNEDNSLNLVCKSNDPNIIHWVAQQWRSIWNVAQPLNNCSTIFEPAGQPAQAVTLVCEHNFLQPDSNGNLVFDFCSQSSCPYSITLPYPANCRASAPWQLVNYGCQNENIAFITIETGLNDLQNLLSGYQAHDCEHDCACIPLDGQPSRLYCYCPEPTIECPVTVCLTIGGVQRCQEFARAGFLPCEAPQSEEPQPVDPCNQYNTPETCKDHLECEWNPTQNVCQTRE